MHVDYPFHIDGRGRTAAADEEDHIRDLIEQVLFTAPGERVNRPDFGSGLLQLVFAPNGDVLAGGIEASAQAALQQWLGGLVEIEAVNVVSEEATLHVEVQYVISHSRERRVAQFTQGS